MAKAPSRYRPRRIVLRNGREITLRAIIESDAGHITRAFERLSDDSRYQRFLQHKKHINAEALERGVHPRPGRDFVFVATVPAGDTIDIVGAAQYVRAHESDSKTCEFAITVAEDWRGTGLARQLLSSLVRRAPHDGYATIEGLVLASNAPMIALARRLKFKVEPVADAASVVRVYRTLAPARRRMSTVRPGPQSGVPAQAA